MQIRNNRLRERRVALGLTGVDLCRKVGIQRFTYSRLERLMTSPFSNKSKGAWTKSVLKLAAFYECNPAELFPVGALIVEEPIVERTFDASEALEAMSSHSLRALLPPEAGVEAGDARSAVERALSTLTPRQETVLRARFGIDSDERTLADIGDELGVCGKSVKDIELRALSVLRKRLGKSEAVGRSNSPIPAPPKALTPPKTNEGCKP